MSGLPVLNDNNLIIRNSCETKPSNASDRNHPKRNPDSLPDMIDIFTTHFGHKIQFTPNAKRSAKGYSRFMDGKNPNQKEREVVYECLSAIAFDLWNCLSTNATGNVERAFNQRNRCKLAMTESSQTQADKKLMESRKQRYNGKEYDFTPHIKCDSGKMRIRIHYAYEPMEKLVIIGRFGGHAVTSGTRYIK